MALPEAPWRAQARHTRETRQAEQHRRRQEANQQRGSGLLDPRPSEAERLAAAKLAERQQQLHAALGGQQDGIQPQATAQGSAASAQRQQVAPRPAMTAALRREVAEAQAALAAVGGSSRLHVPVLGAGENRAAPVRPLIRRQPLGARAAVEQLAAAMAAGSSWRGRAAAGRSSPSDGDDADYRSRLPTSKDWKAASLAKQQASGEHSGRHGEEEGEEEEERRSSPIVELSLLLAECVQHGLRTIAFCKSRWAGLQGWMCSGGQGGCGCSAIHLADNASPPAPAPPPPPPLPHTRARRKLCELVTAYVREILRCTAPQLADSIAVYRAGYRCGAGAPGCAVRRHRSARARPEHAPSPPACADAAPPSGARSSARCTAAACARWQPPMRWSWVSTWAAWTPRCTWASPAPWPRFGSRRGARGGANSRAWASTLAGTARWTRWGVCDGVCVCGRGVGVRSYGGDGERRSGWQGVQALRQPASLSPGVPLSSDGQARRGASGCAAAAAASRSSSCATRSSCLGGLSSAPWWTHAIRRCWVRCGGARRGGSCWLRHRGCRGLRAAATADERLCTRAATRRRAPGLRRRRGATAAG